MLGVPRLAIWISAALTAAAITGVIAWQVQRPSPPVRATAAAPAPVVTAPTTPKGEPVVAAATPAPVKEPANVGPATPAATAAPPPSAPASPPPAPPGSSAAPNPAPKTEQSANLSPMPVPAPTVGIPGAVPQFDVVRVERDGSAVIAGRAAPEAAVVLLDRGQAFDRATADGTGQFALVPQPFAPGEHLLSLRIVSKDGNYTDSAQNVTVWIPAAGKGDVLVALTTPGEPTRILSDTARPPERAAPAPAAHALAIRSAEVEGQGSFFATGSAPAGAKILLYLNNAFVASVTAGADRQWSLKVEKGMRPGGYTIRADQVDGATGRVIARAEAPFNFPAAPRLAQNQPDLLTPAPALPAAGNRASQTKPELIGSLAGASVGAAGETPSAPAKTPIPLGTSQAGQAGTAPPTSAGQTTPRPEAQAAVTGQGARPAKPAAESLVQSPPARGGRIQTAQAPTEPSTVPALTKPAPSVAPPLPPTPGGPAPKAQTNAPAPIAQTQSAPAPAATELAVPAQPRPALPPQPPAQSVSEPEVQAATAPTTKAAPDAPSRDQPELQASDVPANVLAMATESDAKANAVVKELGTALVERGDSLWRISRKVYGRGMRYTQIYEANAVQIRNPDLIYPGQIFVVPNSIAN